MRIVGREADLAMFLDIDIVPGQRQHPFEHRLGMDLVEPQRAVGIGEKRARAGDEGELRTRLAQLGPHEETDKALHRLVGRLCTQP